MKTTNHHTAANREEVRPGNSQRRSAVWSGIEPTSSGSGLLAERVERGK